MLPEQNLVVFEHLPPEAIFAREMEIVLKESDRLFTGEESHGKYFDLNSQYGLFCNIKKLRVLGVVSADDYLTWLQNLHKFQLVPLYIKQSSKYEAYVESLCSYLKDFFQRTNPLVEFSTVEESTNEMFD